jgi:hypothetical protein
MVAGSLVTGIGTGLSKWKHQLALGAIKKNRVKQTSRWKHCAFDQTKIGGDVVKVLGDDAWMSHNRSRHFVTPGVKACKIHISKNDVTHDVRHDVIHNVKT